MYKLKDISVIIVTYNRPKDVRETLTSLKKQASTLREILIVDQSKTNETKKVVAAMKIPYAYYLFSKPPAITIARNFGVKHISKKSKIICFIDDDVTLGDNYFREIIRAFNEYPNANAVAGYTKPPKLHGIQRIENTAKRLFFLSYLESRERARIISTYGNTYPIQLNQIISADWLPGVNMAYKSSVFKEQLFDGNLKGYTVAEDIDFTYRLSQKYPHTVFLTPFASLIHRASKVERTPTEYLSYINQIDHFYFFYKNNACKISQQVKFYWSLLGILLLRMLKLCTTFKKEDYLKLNFFLSSLFYCLTHTSEIKSGKLREFIPAHK